jgi:hypothetical protein
MAVLVQSFSVDVLAAAGVPMMICIMDSSNVVLASTTFTGDGAWHRYYVNYPSSGARIGVRKNNSASTSAFYIDGAMVDSYNNYDQVYFDGDYPGVYWNGTRHASASVMIQPTRRTGGQIFDLDDLSISVCGKKGIGAAPVQHLTMAQPNLDGELFVGSRKMPRTVTLSLDVSGSSLSDLHDKRKAFNDILKTCASPDEDAEVVLMYTGTGDRIYGRFAYDTGMEYQGEDGFTDRVVLRMIGYEPTAWGEFDVCQSLTTVQSVSNANRYVRKNLMIWGNNDEGLNNVMTCIAWRDTLPETVGGVPGIPATIYIGGSFTTASGDTRNRIAIHNPIGDTYTALSTGMNGTVWAIAIGPDGSVYAGGEFTTAGGTTVNYVAKWNGSAWSALGSTGLSGTCYALAVGQDGTLYAGGNFATAAGTTVNNIAKWNGSAWSAMGSTGVNGIVRSIVVARNGDVYVGGYFTQAAGATVNCIAKWNGSAWSALSTGVTYSSGTPFVLAQCFDEAGRLYLGGEFIDAGGVTVANIAMWNGSTFEALGDGVNDQVCTICLDGSSILVGGVFTTAGGLTVDCMAGWNGSSWYHMEVDLPSTVAVWALKVDGLGNLYVGGDFSGTLYGSYQSTVTVACSAKVYPMFMIKRSGGTSAKVKWIENVWGEKIIYLDYALLDGETLQLITQPGELTCMSDLFGEVWRAVLRNSDLSDFCLTPGNNFINVFVDAVGSPTVTAYLQYREMCETFDG